jgi:hypothetical protein
MNTNPKSSLWNFIWQRNKPQLLVIAGLLIAALFLPLSLSESFVNSFSKQWSQWLEAFLAFALVIVAVAIWLNEQREEWVRSLPKKLNVQYMLDGDLFCEIRNAPLTGESDIRAWGQSLAKTCVRSKAAEINFTGFSTSSPKVENKKQIFEHKIFLSSAIPDVEKSSLFVYNDEMGCFDRITESQHQHQL